MFTITIYINTKSTQSNLNRSQKDQGHLMRTEHWERMREGISVLKNSVKVRDWGIRVGGQFLDEYICILKTCDTPHLTRCNPM